MEQQQANSQAPQSRARKAPPSKSPEANAAPPSPWRLSPSVEGAIKPWDPDQPVSASDFTRRILEEGHIKEYANGMFLSLTLNDTQLKKPVQEWLAEIQTLFSSVRLLEYEKSAKQENSAQLSGRLVILGLCLLDRQLRQQLEASQVFEALVQEIQPPLEEILSEQGRDLFFYELPVSVPTWGDDPVSAAAEDRLGRVPFARYLARRLSAVSVREGAYVMHLYAPWGAGKSTTLRFLKLALVGSDKKEEAATPEQEADIRVDTQQQWLVVEFNAWLHQHIQPPWWSLMDRVYRETRSKLQPWDRLREWAWRINFSSILLILAGLVLVWVLVLMLPWILQNLIAPLEGKNQPLFETLSNLAGMAKGIGDILAFIATVWGGILAVNNSLLLGSAKAAQEYKNRARDPMNDIKQRFKTLIRRLRPYRVVVIIDDLDRCHSNYVVELLEGIQTLFRDVPVIFIVAADRSWLNACYEQVYEKLKPQISKPGKSLGDLFLEKAFRFSTPLPGIPPELKQQYWDYILQLKPSVQLAQWASARQKARSLLSQARSEGEIDRQVDSSRSQSFIDRRAVREAAAEQLAQPGVVERIEHSLQKYIDLMEPNPRAMKRLANVYSANLALMYLSEVEIDRHQLVLWTLLSSRWPHLAIKLFEEPDKISNVSGNHADLPQDWKSLIGDDSDEIRAVVNGLPSQGPLTAAAIAQCRLTQA